jgi:two-component system, NtrC family, sensor kinase
MPADSTSPSVPDLQRRVDQLVAELCARTSDHEEALRREAAIAEILQVTNASGGDLALVLNAIIEKATRLCSASYGYIWTYDGESARAVAVHGDARFEEWLLQRDPVRPSQHSPLGRVLLSRRLAHVVDAKEDETYRNDPRFRDLVDRAGLRTLLHVPLRKGDTLLGVITVYRRERQPFTDQQIRLLESFAEQAVIAMENARLLDEQREALERQTATAEVLQAINSSPGDLAPVFETILEKAHTLCGVAYGSLQLYDGAKFRAVAVHSLPEPLARRLREGYTPGSNLPIRRLLEGEDFAHIPDMAVVDDPIARSTVESGGLRTLLSVALRKDGRLLGQIVSARKEVRPFADKEISLLRSFAAQAVIAMENARLLGELRERTDELSESLKLQTATADVLKVISRSTFDLKSVLHTLVESASRLCEADKGTITRLKDGAFYREEAYGFSPEFTDYVRELPVVPGRSDGTARALQEARTIHIADVQADPDFTFYEGQRLGGFRTVLAVPMLREGQPIGAMALTRSEIRPFTDKQIEMVSTFADQAVIAIENARLITETREALEQQTANAEVLQVINASPGNLAPVFEAILEKAMHVCRASFGGLWTFEADRYVVAALHNVPKAYADFLRTTAVIPGPGSAPYRFLHGERSVIRNIDLAAEEPYRVGDPQRRALVELGGARSALQVPLCKDDTVIGVVTIYRQEVREFDERQIALLQSFAAQAVIAIQNARLLSELRERQAELRVTFDNMGDGVAMFDAEPRLAAWNRNFETIIGLPEARLAQRPSYADYLRLLAQRGEFGTENVEAELASRLENTDRELRLERTRADGTVIEVRRNAVPGGGFVLIYSDITERRRAEAEIRSARDAAEAALERQTATADILKVIASSPTDVEPVLAAVVKAAVRFCGATDAMIQLRDGDSVMSRAHEGPLTYNANDRRSLDRSTAGGRAIVDAETCHLPDIEALDPTEFVTARRLAALHGFRAIVAAPLKREGTAIGAVVLRKIEPGPFTPQQIALLETFAAQAVIAIENVRLFTELRDSLERLKAAQANLIQSEKMASLGQLTAGIAHEIKNPLNFVNNFAGLSVELLDELKEVAEPVLAGMTSDARAEFGETIEMITSNLDKIADHGKRADGIVKSMLSHSRGGAGDWQESNINALVEEALNLAYHGARAQDKEFNVTLERDFAPITQPIELVPQDVTRVFLNLFGNGFYAANKRRLSGGEAGYRPTLKVSTRNLGEAVEITVRDNGIGISPEVRAKLFQPFFTTKPTGEGTGLGLSISYDIVTQQHGGTIGVDSEPGSFTEFTVRLPRGQQAARSRGT